MVTLYKANLMEGKYEITLDAIANAFVSSPYNSSEYLHSWPLQRIIRCFLTSKDGLDSSFDEENYDSIHEAIRSRVFPSANAMPK